MISIRRGWCCWRWNCNWWRTTEALRLPFLLFLGQLVSFNLAVISFTSSLLANLGVDAPLTQSFFTYCSLTLVYGSILLYRRQGLRVSWYWYALLALIDVQGNFLFKKAFQFSSITSVTILDCWTVVWVIILTRMFLGTRYSLWQYLGTAICVLGLGLVFLSDAGVNNGGGRTNPILGDVLVIGGTVCYAVSNVSEEYLVKKKDRIEVVSMLGLFGMLISLFAGYALSAFMFYSIVPFVLKMGGSTLFNLSILTSDMWAVIIRIFIYHQKVDWLYYLAFAIVAFGVIIYSVTERDPVPGAVEDGNLNTQYQVLNDENAASRNEVSTT